MLMEREECLVRLRTASSPRFRRRYTGGRSRKRAPLREKFKGGGQIKMRRHAAGATVRGFRVIFLGYVEFCRESRLNSEKSNIERWLRNLKHGPGLVHLYSG